MSSHSKNIDLKFERYFVFITLVLTFFLLLLGGIVHNTESSLACPDWPLCYGQIFPRMEGGILIEHSHRLLASLVGILTFTFTSFFKFKRKFSYDSSFLRWGLIASFMVIIQGVLGGITVIYKLPTLVSTAHLGLAMIFFCTLVFLHHMLGGVERNAKIYQYQKSNEINVPHGLKTLVLISLILLYLQILLGAFMRHSGAGASCGLGWSYTIQCLETTSQWKKVWWPIHLPGQLHMFHRYFAIIVSAIICYCCYKVFHFENCLRRKLSLQNNFQLNALFRPIYFSPILLIVQVFLGMSLIANNIGIISTTAHLGGAALLLFIMWKFFLNLSSLEKKDGSQRDPSFFSDLLELTKPKLSFLVLITFLGGMLMAPGEISGLQGFLVIVLMAMIVGGACTLNCYLERDLDKKMKRTENRPLPSGRLNSHFALVWGYGLLIISFPLLFYITNITTVLLGMVATLFYIFWYTPMKQKSTFALFIGAIPGALPPVMGWSSLTGKLDTMAIILFLILFFWQLPHFLAISIYHINDYRAADIKIVPNLKGIPYTKKSIFFYTFLLFIISILPVYFGITGGVYKQISLILGLFFLGFSLYGVFLGENFERNKIWARQFFLASLFYLPTLFGAMIFF